jgi:hypothetical protein
MQCRTVQAGNHLGFLPAMIFSLRQGCSQPPLHCIQNSLASLVNVPKAIRPVLRTGLICKEKYENAEWA